MDTDSVLGPPCPICGGSAFHRDDENEQLVEIGDARYLARACAECGNIQLVLTRAESSDACLSNI